MAKQHDPLPAGPAEPGSAPRAGESGVKSQESGVRPRASGGTWTVTFAGLAPVTVEAGSAEEAVTVAAEQLGVVRSESKPEVVPA